MNIGPHHLDSNVLLAPMAGISDLPFRRLCRDMGAGLASSEMVSSKTELYSSRKTQFRLNTGDNNDNETSLHSVQIVGNDPQEMAAAARYNEAQGAQIIDINMGCPAKKVCKKAAGSALLQDEKLVQDILEAVVAAVNVPVTLKIRTGWCPEKRNGVTIARIAEQTGIAALAVHGRTRACRFQGEAEYDTIAAISDATTIPVIANGDIDSPQKARQVLNKTGAAAVMIGRACQGQPWLLRDIKHFLQTGSLPSPLSLQQKNTLIDQHICAIHQHYGDYLGVRIARKHMSWYLNHRDEPNDAKQLFRTAFNSQTDAHSQLQLMRNYFLNQPNGEVIAA